MKSQPSHPDILYIITQGNWGGAQRYVHDLAQEMAANFQVMVGAGKTQGTQELLNKVETAGLHTYHFRHLVRHISPWHDIAAIWELKTAFQTLKPRLVHLNSSKAGIIGTLAALLISAKERPTIVYTAHGWVFNEPLPWITKQIYFYLEKWTAQGKDAIIVTSPEEALVATEQLKIPSHKVSYIPLGLDAPQFFNPEQARAQVLKKVQANSESISESVPWHATIANSYRTKGLDILLSAISQSKNPAEYFIIGHGPEQTKLINQAKKYNLKQVHFLGAIPNAAELLQAFDGFILPSRKEGLPYALLEALSAGIPIIATRVGGIPSLAKKYSNITIIDPENSHELTAALQNFSHNQTKAQHISSAQDMATETTSLYKKISLK